MSWSVGSGCRASIANWRSWPLRGARSKSYLRADGLCIGVQVGAFPPRSDVGYLGNRQAYDFGREIWGGRDRLQKFDGSWPLRRSTAFHEAREDVERGNVEVGDGVGTAHCET